MLGACSAWWKWLWFVDDLLARGYPLRRSRICLVWWARPWLMENPLVRRSPSERLITRMSSNDGLRLINRMSGSDGYGWDLWLLLLHHKILLLPPLHHHNQYLDLLHRRSKEVLLDHRWWGGVRGSIAGLHYSSWHGERSVWLVKVLFTCIVTMLLGSRIFFLMMLSS